MGAVSKRTAADHTVFRLGVIATLRSSHSVFDFRSPISNAQSPIFEVARRHPDNAHCLTIGVAATADDCRLLSCSISPLRLDQRFACMSDGRDKQLWVGFDLGG